MSLRMAMTRNAMRKEVLKKVRIGCYYRVKSVTSTLIGAGGYENSELVFICKNFVVFEHQNRTKECFTYADIWRQMHTGEFW